MFVMLDINIPLRSINIFQQDAPAVVLSIGHGLKRVFLYKRREHKDLKIIERISEVIYALPYTRTNKEPAKVLFRTSLVAGLVATFTAWIAKGLCRFEY
jgi:hypothetical protein